MSKDSFKFFPGFHTHTTYYYNLFSYVYKKIAMKQHIFTRFVLVTVFLLIQGCNEKCSTRREDIKPDKEVTNDWNIKGNLWKAYAVIDATDLWLKPLGIIDKTKKDTVVVNAANSNITSPRGGIDGALGGWAKANGATPWTNPTSTLPSGSIAPRHLDAGQFALFSVSFGYIYLAVGPTCSQVKTLPKTSELMKDLYYNILAKAQEDHMKRVVLCAISTSIFAGAGSELETGKKFTELEFLQSVYAGAKSGIAKFQQEHPNHTLQVILNNWGRLGNNVNSRDEVGLELVKEVKDFIY